MSNNSIVRIRHLIYLHKLQTHRSYLQYLANHEQYSYQKFVLRVQTRDDPICRRGSEGGMLAVYSPLGSNLGCERWIKFDESDYRYDRDK
jgi:hypothetical protein